MVSILLYLVAWRFSVCLVICVCFLNYWWGLIFLDSGRKIGYVFKNVFNYFFFYLNLNKNLLKSFSLTDLSLKDLLWYFFCHKMEPGNVTKWDVKTKSPLMMDVKFEFSGLWLFVASEFRSPLYLNIDLG